MLLIFFQIIRWIVLFQLFFYMLVYMCKELYLEIARFHEDNFVNNLKTQV